MTAANGGVVRETFIYLVAQSGVDWQLGVALWKNYLNIYNNWNKQRS